MGPQQTEGHQATKFTWCRTRPPKKLRQQQQQQQHQHQQYNPPKILLLGHTERTQRNQVQVTNKGL